VVISAEFPTPLKISWFSDQKSRLAQNQQHKQQQQQKTKQQTIAKPFQNLSSLDFDWLHFNEVRTKTDRCPNQVGRKYEETKNE